MIISRAPVRITLGGGGTDLKSYYAKYGGFLIAAAIDRYVFLSANKRFYDSIRLSYSKTEIVNDVSQIKHSIFREAMKLMGVDGGIELVSIADVPANCGLGTSSSFTVSLLNALHTYKRDYVTQKQLAEEACNIEIDILGEPIGKQDQYIAAFGGVTCLNFEKNGEVIVEPLKIPDEALDQLENNIFLFHTGIERSASDILQDQDTRSKKDDQSIIDNLHAVKEIGLRTKKALEQGDIDSFGELLNEHWEIKKKRSNKMSDPFMDECYENAKKNGALGGKIIGAGGGGFFMFYCNGSNATALTTSMKKMGLKPMKFHFDFEGAKILVNMKRH
jgi:D-glycero-alpha-D-manno-heptose-7-phosphate kinase